MVPAGWDFLECAPVRCAGFADMDVFYYLSKVSSSSFTAIPKVDPRFYLSDRLWMKLLVWRHVRQTYGYLSSLGILRSAGYLSQTH